MNTLSGERVGWVDLVSDRVVLEDPQYYKDFWEAIDHVTGPLTRDVSEFSDTRTDRSPAPCSEPVRTAPQQVPELPRAFAPHGNVAAVQAENGEPDWFDLSLNRPGEGIRRIAMQKWEADPLGILRDELGGVYTDERAFRIGADGEEVVGAELSDLPGGWHVIHSIPVGTRGADIDHLAIGPGGVFTINTKHHPDARVWAHGPIVRVNQNRQDYVPTSKRERSRASRRLSTACQFPVPVTAIIAIVGARGRTTVKSQPADGSVVIMDHDRLRDWILCRDTAMADGQVDWIYSRARRSTTWT